MITDNEFYYWSTEEEHSDNNITMGDFLDNELTDDYEITLVDETYAEIKERDGFYWAVHAYGNGDFRSHVVRFDSIGVRL